MVRRSYEIPSDTFEINVTGTANLLEVVHHLHHKCSIIVVTSDKVYENKEKDILYNEDDVLGGYDPYSASKACTEIVVSSFRKSFFNSSDFHSHKKAIGTARAGNVIGGGDWSKDRIIPDIIRSLQQKKSIEVRNPEAIRPWQHVLEPICGYLLLGGLLNDKQKKFSKAYNFGPSLKDHLKVKQVVKKAIKIWGSGDWEDVSDHNQPHEAGILKLDIGRAKKELHWKPKLNSSRAIKWTIDWYRQPINEQAEYTFKQIRDYFAL